MNHQVFISYSQQDGLLANGISDILESQGIRCWIAPRDIAGGHHWDEAIIAAIPESHLLLVIVSAHADRSLHVKREISLASDHGVPILPVRVEDVSIQRLRYYLGTCQWLDAYPPPLEKHREALLAAVRRLLGTPPMATALTAAGSTAVRSVYEARNPKNVPDGVAYRGWDPLCGALQVNSPYYVCRPMDEQLHAAISRQDSLVVIKGTRQLGKTSLLAQGVHHARANGRQVVWTDLQSLNVNHNPSLEGIYHALGHLLANQLGLPIRPEHVWDPLLGPNLNFARFVQEALGQVSGEVVWAVDEADRLAACPLADEFFGLLRSWHNARAVDPHSVWWRLTVALACATEAALLPHPGGRWPLDVGTRIVLEDFAFEQVADLNWRYGSPLRNDTEVAAFYRLFGGQPFLVRNGLHHMVADRLNLSDLEQQSFLDDGPFGEHLRRLLVFCSSEPELRETLQEILRGRPGPSVQHFYRLQGAGVLAGKTVHDARPRCQLYATYLERHLL